MKSTPQLILNGYVLENAFYHLSGNAQWTYAEKNGRLWFVKRFTNPVRPNLRGTLDRAYVEECKETFHCFLVKKLVIYATVNSCDNGNIITIKSIFSRENRCHVVTERVQVDETVRPKDVNGLSKEDKYLLTKVLADSLARLHRRHIVYADLRPDNVLLKRSPKGRLIPKLIDFDGCYFEKYQPDAEDLPISEQYIAPETARVYFDKEKLSLTTKVDVFSLGLLFHLYWTGDLPWFDKDKYGFAFEAAMDGPRELKISQYMPEELATLIGKMLSNCPEDRPTMEEVFLELKNITGDRRETEPDTKKDEPIIRIGTSMRTSPSSPKKRSLSEEESEEDVRRKIIKALNGITRESKSNSPDEDISSALEEAKETVMNKKWTGPAKDTVAHGSGQETERATVRDSSGGTEDPFYEGFRLGFRV